MQTCIEVQFYQGRLLLTLEHFACASGEVSDSSTIMPPKTCKASSLVLRELTTGMPVVVSMSTIFKSVPNQVSDASTDRMASCVADKVLMKRR